jgi:hypothetical protein
MELISQLGKSKLRFISVFWKLTKTLRIEKPIFFKKKESSADNKANFVKLERSNRMSLLIMKNTITSAIRGGIPENDAESNLFTAKEYLFSVEEQFKSTSKASVSALIMKIHIMIMNDIAAKFKDKEHMGCLLK